MRILIAQINPVVGDISGNVRLIRRVLEGAPAGIDLVVFPEMCITGYPARDLVERPAFIAEARDAVEVLARDTHDGTPGVVVGAPVDSGHRSGTGVANAALLLGDGRVIHVQHKSLLPTYDVFDEARYFDPADEVRPVDFHGARIGLTICEDMWNLPARYSARRYPFDPIARLAGMGANTIINISASPFTSGKEGVRLDLLASHARTHGVAMVMANQVGGNDELVFDGTSAGVGSDGAPRVILPSFEEDTAIFDADAPPVVRPSVDSVDNVYRALVMGTHDYVTKCGFERALVGLSGGIDSAVTLAVAVDALGAPNVEAVAMPSPFSSAGSVTDARTLASNLGVVLHEIPVGGVMDAYEAALAGVFKGCNTDVTEENIQARIRGNLLMAMSNKFGSLLFTTGNKSELAVGYCTLYGDMSGGLAVISDVPKTMVYRLAARINRQDARIPDSIRNKPPSAELRPGQKDTDTLPDYDVLDAILEQYVDQSRSRGEILKQGFDSGTVDWVLRAVRRAEYKRR